MNFIEYADREMMMIDLANILAAELTSTLMHEDQALLVVPGGTTPGPIFDVLCAVDLDWAQISVMLSDERWVPEVSPRSNTRLLRERLLIERAGAARYLPLYSEAEKPEEKLSELAAGLAPKLPISVLLLGMGDDMHTASIFPQADKLAQALAPDAPPLLAMRAPGAPEPRVTLSARVLDNALAKHVVITGPQKRAALERAVEINDPLAAPICAVLGGATVHWAL
ncbi:MAG: 6-phosphogluconolactonase [Marinosulfonomonas sp.]|nr:6-phosphogluconolactonase [Marinosulfonomonas sp.]